MRVKSESEWQLFCAELAADQDERAQPFRDFVCSWAERAEQIAHDYEMHPAQALREALRPTEAELGRWTVGYVGLMLVVLGTHWELAGDVDRFFGSLTPIEQNLFADTAALKKEQLEEMAKAMSTPAGGAS